MKEKMYADLESRILARLSIPPVRTIGDEMSVGTLVSLLYDRFSKYNNALVKDSYLLIQSMNEKTRLNRFFKGEIPYISKMVSIIDENGECHLELKFTAGNYIRVGEAIIDKDCNISVNTYRYDYDNEKTLEFLKDYSYKFFQYISVLNAFACEFPNTRCEWNNGYSLMNEDITDNFITSHIYLDRLENSNVALTDKNDKNISRDSYGQYGELNDYFDVYKSSFFNRQRVNINDLNPLYQRILEKDMQLEKGPLMKRAK